MIVNNIAALSLFLHQQHISLFANFFLHHTTRVYNNLNLNTCFYFSLQRICSINSFNSIHTKNYRIVTKILILCKYLENIKKKKKSYLSIFFFFFFMLRDKSSSKQKVFEFVSFALSYSCSNFVVSFFFFAYFIRQEVFYWLYKSSLWGFIFFAFLFCGCFL